MAESDEKSNLPHPNYRGYPDLPNPEARDEMTKLLDDLCTTKPADADRLNRIWRILTRQDGPKFPERRLGSGWDRTVKRKK